MTSSAAPLRIFICYARSDNVAPHLWLDRVRKQLQAVHHSVLVEVDSDQEIRTGVKWHEYIQEKLGQADVAVLLVSADFLASKYVREHELPRLLRRFSETGGLHILPVILSPFAHDGMLLRYPDPFHGPEEFDLTSLQSIGTLDSTLIEMEGHKQIRALASLANEVSRIAKEKLAAKVSAEVPAVEDVVIPAAITKVQMPPEFEVFVVDEQAMARPFWASDFGEDQYGIYADFNVDGIVQRCRWIRPGKFFMGSGPEEKKHFIDEHPQHEVTLSGYWLADTDCTQALWLAVMGHNPSDFKDDSCKPVDSVNWEDAQVFLAKLNYRVPGLAAGLPSEAQWENACRAGTTTPFSFGNGIASTEANFGGMLGTTTPVGSLVANAWGEFEMHGNVWEWCSDWFGLYVAESQVDPEGPISGTERVQRGGSFKNGVSRLRSAHRRGYQPTMRSHNVGLRIAPGRSGVV